MPVELTGGTAFPNIGLRPYLLTLPGYGSYWFSIVPARQTCRAAGASTEAMPVRPDGTDARHGPVGSRPAGVPAPTVGYARWS